MYVTVSGIKDQVKIDQLKEASVFYASLLLDPRIIKNIDLDIVIDKSMDVQGECICEDDSKNPRIFTINLRNKRGDEPIFRTLAHEMVHLKQYAKRELGNEIMLTTRGGVKIVTKWKGQIWKSKSKECPYWDSPWEIESYGREVGLFWRWTDYMSKKT